MSSMPLLPARAAGRPAVRSITVADYLIVEPQEGGPKIMQNRIRTVGAIVLSACMASVLVLAAAALRTGFAQDRSTTTPNPPGQNPAPSEQQPAQGKEESKKDHLKKWSGKLVDLPCMEKGLASAAGAMGTREKGVP